MRAGNWDQTQDGSEELQRDRESKWPGTAECDAHPVASRASPESRSWHRRRFDAAWIQARWSRGQAAAQSEGRHARDHRTSRTGGNGDSARPRWRTVPCQDRVAFRALAHLFAAAAAVAIGNGVIVHPPPSYWPCHVLHRCLRQVSTTGADGEARQTQGGGFESTAIAREYRE